ncbi:Mitochondrial outer membrane protein iml2 [Rhizopus stolonifer]|uniref:Mitochondrial outer membrane protein iml2 n=1 Tax=Rhizopus stolonifer TaxID=4846 RepID=A0A367JJF1_RHIST|nr:Mitochondrial outer membrane protein iml2 [Rhizopus stolonifer]
MFETLTGQRALDYAVDLKRIPQERRLSLFTYQNSEKRLSMFDKPTVSKYPDVTRPRSTFETSRLDESRDIIENAIESGIFFGIGLFSLVFSLLPPKVNKILNTLGFQSSRPFALHLLQKSFRNLGLYSSLSALSILAYYTNLSLFVHPQLLPNSLSLEKAREILDQMKICFPNGKIWKLLEGKLCKMEGKTRRGVEILRDVRSRESVKIEILTGKLHTLPQKKKDRMVCELPQLQALAVYEMGWGQIFLGDYFQASETFFRLEGMNNWSRAFYHYIATCCMFADEAYDKSAREFMQIPGMLKRKRQFGGKLLPNEIYAERKIKHWIQKSFGQEDGVLDGKSLRKAVVINPLWELIYLWNGFSQLTVQKLESMHQIMKDTLAGGQEIESDIGQLYLLLGVGARELGDYDQAESYLRKAAGSDDEISEDAWVLPHAYYEMAALNCVRLLYMKKDDGQKVLLKEAGDWIQKCEKQLTQRNSNTDHNNDTTHSDSTGDSDWDSRLLHVRCQLLIEKLDDFNTVK